MTKAANDGTNEGAISSTEPPISGASIQTVSQLSIIGLFAMAVLAVLSYASPLIVPVALALVIATIMGPSVTWLCKRGIPRVISAVALVLVLFGIMIFLAITLTTPLTEWIGRASELGVLLRGKLNDFSQPFSALQEVYREIQQMGSGGTENPGAIEVAPSEGTSIVGAAIGVLTPALSQLLIFFVSLIFYLIYKDEFKNFIVMTFASRNMRMRILRAYNDVEQTLSKYFSTFTFINIGLAVVVTVALYLAGMPNALLWGVLAGLFNFLPYLGPAIVTVALIVASLLAFPTVPEALVPPIVYFVIHLIEGEFVTPSILGFSLAINPFFLFLAVIFWTWMWGPAGAFLAVPITMITVRIAHHLLGETEVKQPLPG
jgi:predicted PurR-regulated permease PerM